MLEGYSSFKITDAFIDALLRAVENYSPRAVAEACRRFADGNVPGHNNAFVPNAAELAEQCRLFEGIYNRAVVPLHSGLMEIDYGHGRIDLRGLTVAEQDQVMERNGIGPDGRNLALMSLEEKRAALNPAPADKLAAPRARLQRV